MHTKYDSTTALHSAQDRLEDAAHEIARAQTHIAGWESTNAERYRDTLKDLEAGIKAIEDETFNIKIGFVRLFEDIAL